MRRGLITGSSRGLGLAICERLLVEGWYIVASSRSMSPELDLLLKSYPNRSEYHPADLSQAGAIEGLAKSAGVVEGMDGFVANAAIGTEGLLTLTSEAAIRECIEVNLLAPVLLARAAVKGMLTRGGSIIFISSIAGRTGFAGLTVYSATKGGLIAFSRSLAREYGERGIRSNCILPGFMETEMTNSLSAMDRARLRRRTPLGRLGAVSDIVGTVSFLLSDAAQFMTGTELVIDGGALA